MGFYEQKKGIKVLVLACVLFRTLEKFGAVLLDEGKRIVSRVEGP